MINLLPPKEKEAQKQEVKKRIIIILWFLFLFFLLCLILVLFSVKIYFDGQIDSQKIFIQEIQKKREESDFSEVKKDFAVFNGTLGRLDDFYSQKAYFSRALEKIINLLPKDAYLNGVSISYLEVEKGKFGVRVGLSGIISSR